MIILNSKSKFSSLLFYLTNSFRHPIMQQHVSLIDGNVLFLAEETIRRIMDMKLDIEGEHETITSR